MAMTPEEIIKTARNLKYCSENTGECFHSELCPVSHSTACCMHCKEFDHGDIDEETRLFIEKHGHCNDIRCFRAKAILMYGAKIPQPKP
ncbi:MAG: hypothetical protein KAS32_04420 [Candidatus Peribacteraceae bacterium]|nr:hypothetical protein [Candidatus Peribacteraceae bacterium]